MHFDVHLLLHTVVHEPSQKPHKKIINKSTCKSGSLSQIARKIMIVKCKIKMPKTKRILIPNESSLPLMKLPRELLSPYTMIA